MTQRVHTDCGFLGFGRETINAASLCGEDTLWNEYTGFCEAIRDTPGTHVDPPSDTPGTHVDPPSDTQLEGHFTRYWDCCKPSCSWNGKSNHGRVLSCGKNGVAEADPGEKSICQGGDATTCFNNAPFISEDDDSLSYGFVAAHVSPEFGENKSCGACFEATFTGEGRHDKNDPGSKSLANKNKRMIVQSTNIGYDVGPGGQFDLLVPGGGVGYFDGCTQQFSNENLGERYGGFLASCKREESNDHERIKDCVRDKCRFAFKNDKFSNDILFEGCNWFVNWYDAADNPMIKFRSVECPKALTDISGLEGVPKVNINEAFSQNTKK